MTSKSYRAAVGIGMAALLLSAAGCKTQQSAERQMQDMEPAAIAAAKDRARIDLSCESDIDARVLKRTASDASAYGLDRAEFEIATTGCKHRIVLNVACGKGPIICSALRQNPTVERVDSK